MTIDLEESESLKNKTDFNLKEMELITNNMIETKQIASQTIHGFATFIKDMVEDMTSF